MITRHVRRQYRTVHVNNLANTPAYDPALALVAAVFRQAHRDARQGNRGAAMWLAEMQRRTRETLEGRRYERRN